MNHQLDYRYTVLAWEPNRGITGSEKVPAGSIEIREWDNRGDWWSGAYHYTGGGGFYPAIRNSDDDDLVVKRMFSDFHACVLRDHIQIEFAHREFLKVKQYCDAIAPSIPGATPSADPLF